MTEKLDGFSYAVLRDVESRINLKRNARILVSHSAGPDSSVLAEVFSRIAKVRPLSIEWVYFNHGKRDQSVLERDYLAERASKQGIPFHYRERSDWSVGNFQDAARQWRKEAIGEIVRENGIDLVLTGHHADDQVETCLWKIFRGTSLFKLRAIRFYDPPYLRPLLNVFKTDLLAFAHQNNIRYFEDASNAEVDFTRNKTRHLLLPQLEEVFGPSTKRKLLELVGHSAELEKLYVEKADSFNWNDAELLELPDVFLKERIARLLSQAGYWDTDKERIGQITELLRSNRNGWRIELKGTDYLTRTKTGGIEIIKE